MVKFPRPYLLGDDKSVQIRGAVFIDKGTQRENCSSKNESSHFS